MPWTAFNTKCWDNSGTAYGKEPISSVSILVPGTNSAAVPFSFCLNNVGESADATGGMPAAGTGAMPAAGTGGGAGMMSSSGGPGMGMGMLSGQFDWHAVTRDGREYIVQNNVWGGSGSQALTYNGTSFEITAQSGNNPTTGAPASYPSVFIGSNNGHTSNGSGLPKQVSALASVKTSWSHNGSPSIGGTYNAAYDVWFSTNAGGDSGAPSGGYLMVWLYKTANVQPLGNTIAQSGATIPGVEGTWDVWIGQQMGKPCISYVRTQTLASINYDLNAFIQDAVKRPEKPIQSSWYLTNVFAGFEIWSGGTGLKTNEFSAVVQ
jgi:Glycosyl hydrolase family 12